jgi:PhnB protein
MTFNTSIAPWLSARRGREALAFYKSAFGAAETYRHDGPDETIVAKVSIRGAEFWVADDSPENCHPARIILTVEDPDAVFAQAIAAGATQVYPISEGHGWRVGRVVDPFGHHWEIGRPV